jgi:hypothetical protein
MFRYLQDINDFMYHVDNGQCPSISRIEPEDSNMKGFCVSFKQVKQVKQVKQLKCSLDTRYFQNFARCAPPLKYFINITLPFQNKCKQFDITFSYEYTFFIIYYISFNASY